MGWVGPLAGLLPLTFKVNLASCKSVCHASRSGGTSYCVAEAVWLECCVLQCFRGSAAHSVGPAGPLVPFGWIPSSHTYKTSLRLIRRLGGGLDSILDAPSSPSVGEEENHDQLTDRSVDRSIDRSVNRTRTGSELGPEPAKWNQNWIA